MLAHQLWMDVPYGGFYLPKPSGNMELGKKEGIVNISDAMSPKVLQSTLGWSSYGTYADAYGLWKRCFKFYKKNATEIDIQELDALKWKEAQNVKSVR